MIAKVFATRGRYVSAYCGRPGCPARFGQVVDDWVGYGKDADWVRRIILPQPWEPGDPWRHGKNRRTAWPTEEPPGAHAYLEDDRFYWRVDLPAEVECPRCGARQTVVA